MTMPARGATDAPGTSRGSRPRGKAAAAAAAARATAAAAPDVAAPGALRPRFAQKTAQGRRPTNQDMVAVAEIEAGRAYLAVVADGMGGYAGGERASAIATEIIQDLALALRGHLTPDDDAAIRQLRSRVRDGYRDVQAAIASAADADPDLAQMGTTLVVAGIVGSRYFLANVGDSRAYRFDADGMVQVTEDHTVENDARRAHIPFAKDTPQARRMARALTRALRPVTPCEPEFFPPAEQAEFFVAAEGDTLLLCSDGLTGNVSAPAMALRLQDGATLDDALAALEQDALTLGSTDNVSTVAVVFGERVRTTPTAAELFARQNAASVGEAAPRRLAGPTATPALPSAADDITVSRPPLRLVSDGLPAPPPSGVAGDGERPSTRRPGGITKGAVASIAAAICAGVVLVGMLVSGEGTGSAAKRGTGATGEVAAPPASSPPAPEPAVGAQRPVVPVRPSPLTASPPASAVPAPATPPVAVRERTPSAATQPEARPGALAGASGGTRREGAGGRRERAVRSDSAPLRTGGRSGERPSAAARARPSSPDVRATTSAPAPRSPEQRSGGAGAAPTGGSGSAAATFGGGSSGPKGPPATESGGSAGRTNL